VVRLIVSLVERGNIRLVSQVLANRIEARRGEMEGRDSSRKVKRDWRKRRSPEELFNRYG
jgi:hypothetical protein